MTDGMTDGDCKARRSEIIQKKIDAIKAAEQTAKAEMAALNDECKKKKTTGTASTNSGKDVVPFYTTKTQPTAGSGVKYYGRRNGVNVVFGE